jgi:hypothetical protein
MPVRLGRRDRRQAPGSAHVLSSGNAILQLMQTFRAVQVAKLDPAEAGRGWPLSGERWVLHQPGTREVMVLDRHFEPVWRLRLPSAWGRVCAVAEDLSLVACSLGSEVRLSDAAGGQVARLHLAPRETPRWDANCVFARDGRHLWAHAFIDDRDELWLIDLAELSIVDHRRLDTWAAGLVAFHHPDRQTIGLELAEGQDGCAIRWARPIGSRIELRCPPGFDRVLADLHPSGEEYVTTPHHGGEWLARHRFDDDRVIDRLPAGDALPVAEEWDASPDGWYYCAGYLTDEVILASAQNDAYLWHALVKRSPMGVLGRVDYGPTMWAPGEFLPPQAGTWVTIGDTGTQRWELAEEPATSTQLSLLEDT